MRKSARRSTLALAVAALTMGAGAAPVSAVVIGLPITEWIGNCGLYYMNSSYPTDQFAITAEAGGECSKMSVRARFYVPANGGYAYTPYVYNYQQAEVDTGNLMIYTSWHACFVGTSGVKSRSVY